MIFGRSPFARTPFGSSGLSHAWFHANFARQQNKPEEDKFFAAFGRFIASYALAEAAFHIAARHFSGLPEDKARTILGGMRISDLIEKLRALIDAEDTKKLFNDLIEQLNVIGTERDQFVHRLVEVESGGSLIVTNRLLSKSMEPIPPRKFTLDELEAMEFDCRVIAGRIATYCRQTDSALIRPELSLGELLGSWRYKRPGPDNPKKKNRAAQKESRRQLRASRESPPDQSPK